MNQHNIRFAIRSDVSKLQHLLAAHAAYEKAAFQPEGAAERLEAALFSDPPVLYCLVVELDEDIIGYATYMKQYSTWDAGWYVYMDTLFMNETSRGRGVGEELMTRIKLESQKLGCSLIQWQTPDFNTRAIKFYHRIGATSKPKERFFLAVNGQR